jgi:hypothetical protein
MPEISPSSSSAAATSAMEDAREIVDLASDN